MGHPPGRYTQWTVLCYSFNMDGTRIISIRNWGYFLENMASYACRYVIERARRVTLDVLLYVESRDDLWVYYNFFPLRFQSPQRHGQ